MQTKLNLRKVLALGATLAMLATSALASSTSSWPVYGGNANHNSVVSGAPTSSPTVAEINLLNANSGWDGVDTVPVMETVDGVTYAYVLYDGHAAGSHLAKFNCGTAISNAGSSGDAIYAAAKEWDVQLGSTSGFQLSTPVLYEDTVYVATNGGEVYAVDTSNGAKSLVVSVSTGQINTPLTIYDDYLYFGTWVGNGTIEGATAPGRYYQVDLTTDTNNVQSVSSIAKGFYWAGAVVSGSYIYFGGDGGYLYYRPVGDTFGTESDTDIQSTSLNLATATGGASDVGNIRSTVMLDGGKLYFTSQGKYLWCCTIGSGGAPAISWKASLGGTSTSTPTKVGDRIYVGYYSGFSAGGVQCVGANGSHTVTTVASGFPVQSSILVQGAGTGTDYLYFNTNSGSGAGYCYSYNGSAGASVWSTRGDTYALGGMACDNGYLVFGNDYNHLYVVK